MMSYKNKVRLQESKKHINDAIELLRAVQYELEEALNEFDEEICEIKSAIRSLKIAKNCIERVK